MDTLQLEKKGKQIIGSDTFKGVFPAHHPNIETFLTSYPDQTWSIILNTDTKKYPGQHWVALLCDVTNNTSYFFDSYGYSARHHHQDWALLLNTYLRYKWDNKKRVQYASNTCGLHCLFFLDKVTHSASSANTVVNNMSDDVVVKWGRHHNIKLSNKMF